MEKNKIGKVILGQGQGKKEVDLFSCTKKDPYRYWQEANGEEFDGHRTMWSFSYEPYTYLKESELSGDEYRKGGSAKIFRNGVCVLNEFCREPHRAFRILSWYLPILQEFDFDNAKVGRKIYHAGVESIIDSINADGEITVRTESGEHYEIYGFKKEDPKNFEDEWKDKDRIHITDTRIDWYRK